MEEVSWIGCENRKRLGIEARGQIRCAKKYNRAGRIDADAACARNLSAIREADLLEASQRIEAVPQEQRRERRAHLSAEGPRWLPSSDGIGAVDRKSTRLNSS